VLAAQQLAAYDRVENDHLVRRHGAIALADGALALVLDEASGGSLAQLVGARGQLTAGETVTTVAPLFMALEDLHHAGVVHGDLAPGNVLFSAEGRPLIAGLGLAELSGRSPGSLGETGTGGFMAPELAHGGAPSPDSDVYAMAALGWFCLTGAPPAPTASRRSLTTLRPDVPLRLLEVLTSCLATDPSTRPSAGLAALETFDAAPAESVALASVPDPAAEITRRIRAAAASVADPAPLPKSRKSLAALAFGVVMLLVAVLLAVGGSWVLRRPPSGFSSATAARPAAAARLPRATRPPTGRVRASTLPTLPATLRRSIPVTAPTTDVPPPASAAEPGSTSQSAAEVATASNSPRTAPAGVLQGLVDARALAYVARDSTLLDLVYAPGAAQASVDKGNIATALRNGGTYLGLSFVIKDVAFLDGTSETARIRATILTPAYQTGQPDGRKIRHAHEILGPCIFVLRLTPDGWRVLDLSTP